MREFNIAVCEKAHLDTVGVQAFVVDQLACKHLRLRRVVRLDVDPALEALEAVAVGIAEILVEGDTIRVHLALLSFRRRAAPYSRSIMPARSRRVAPHDLMIGLVPTACRCKPRTQIPDGGVRSTRQQVGKAGNSVSRISPANGRARRNGAPIISIILI